MILLIILILKALILKMLIDRVDYPVDLPWIKKVTKIWKKIQVKSNGRQYFIKN